MRLVGRESRIHTRTVPGLPLIGNLRVRGQRFPTKVVDYSFKGLGVHADPDLKRLLSRHQPEIDFELSGVEYPVEIRHTQSDAEKVVLGLEILEREKQEDLQFEAESAGWDLIESPETLKTIFADLTYKGPEAIVTGAQFRNREKLIPVKVNEEAETLRLERFEAIEGALSLGRAKFQFELFQTHHGFDSEVVHVDDKFVEVKLPKQLARVLRRETVRVQNGDNGVKLTVKLKNELLGESPKEIELLDFSEHGFSILDPTGWSCAPKGIAFEEIEIQTQDGEKIRGTGSIRSHRWISLLNAYSVGVEFVAATDSDRNEWHNLILEARYPSFSFNYRDEDHTQIWDLFDKSGFLKLKPRESFNLVYDITKSTWKNLSNAGSKFEKRVLIRQHDQVVGHLQLDRIYPNTWCAHALAIDPSVSKIVGREIYSITSDVLSSENASYMISITNSHKPWNQRSYYDFVKTYRFPDHNELKLFQLHEADIGKGWDLERSPRVQIRPANQYDKQRIIRFFEINGSELERGALSLNREDLELSSLDSELKPYSLTRSRQFLAAFLGGRFVGFAGLEMGTTGISIFGVQDTLYIYTLPELGYDTYEVFDSLFDSALDLYRDLGIRTVNAYVPFIRREHYTERGLKFFMEGMRWITKRDTSKRYHAFTQMLYGHLILQRDKNRRRREDLHQDTSGDADPSQ